MALLVRRKRWIIYPFVALSCTVAVIALILPKVFVSSALIQIRPRDVPTDFVKDLIAGSTETRLSSIEQTVLSRTNLTRISRDFEAQMPDFRNLNMDERVAKLRGQIKLNFRPVEVGSGQLPVTTFTISYQNRDPQLAQKIASKITDLFLLKDAETRQDQVNGTVEFLQSELDKLNSQVKESDAKLKILKARNRNELPSQLESNLRRQESAMGAQQTYAEQSLRIGKEMRELQQLIDETPKEIPKPTAPAPPQDEIDQDPNIAKYRSIKAQLKELSDKLYGENFPTVQVLKLQMERLKAEMTPEDIELAEKKEEKPKKKTPAEVEMMPNPKYVNLIKERDDLRFQISIWEGQKNRNDQAVDTFTRRIENAPQVEEDMVDVLRENSDLNKQVDVTKAKLNDSNMSLSLESKQKGDQFQVLDPANLPQTPTKPQKYYILAMGTLLSLLGGIAIGFVSDIANQKMWTASDVEALLGATVLVEIPEIVTASDTELARKKKRKHLASVAAIAAAYGAALYFIYLHQGFVVRQLEPYLQRFY